MSMSEFDHGGAFDRFADADWRSRPLAANYSRRRIDTPYLQLVSATICDVFLSGEDGPVGTVMSRVGDDIYLMQLPHDPECVILVDERKGIVVDPGDGLYEDFPGRVEESERYRLTWGAAGKSTRALPDTIATPAAVASAWAIAPGEVWVVRA
jgi:hypothetical protein